MRTPLGVVFGELTPAEKRDNDKIITEGYSGESHDNLIAKVNKQIMRG